VAAALFYRFIGLIRDKGKGIREKGKEIRGK